MFVPSCREYGSWASDSGEYQRGYPARPRVRTDVAVAYLAAKLFQDKEYTQEVYVDRVAPTNQVRHVLYHVSGGVRSP
jgi:hypothetical protein